MKILSWKLKNKNNPNVFVVETDVGFFDIHSDILVKNNLKIGEIENGIFYDSVNDSEIIIGFNLATKYISSKLKTEQQIKDYLYKKEFHKQAVEKVVEKLKEYKIIDDNNYAESYIKSNPNFSRNKLRQKLFSMGVKSDIAEKSVQSVDDYYSCKKHAEKYLKNKLIDKQTIDKLIRRLQGMGYGWDEIKHTLNEIKYNIED